MQFQEVLTERPNTRDGHVRYPAEDNTNGRRMGFNTGYGRMGR